MEVSVNSCRITTACQPMPLSLKFGASGKIAHSRLGDGDGYRDSRVAPSPPKYSIRKALLVFSALVSAFGWYLKGSDTRKQLETSPPACTDVVPH